MERQLRTGVTTEFTQWKRQCVSFILPNRHPKLPNKPNQFNQNPGWAHGICLTWWAGLNMCRHKRKPKHNIVTKHRQLWVSDAQVPKELLHKPHASAAINGVDVINNTVCLVASPGSMVLRRWVCVVTLHLLRLESPWNCSVILRALFPFPSVCWVVLHICFLN